jgi:predicted class III extradiol MEMO1 family dioxygenase
LPAVADQFYPGEKGELEKMIDDFLAQAKAPKIKAKLLKYQNSGDTILSEKFQVVVYSAIAFYL